MMTEIAYVSPEELPEVPEVFTEIYVSIRRILEYLELRKAIVLINTSMMCIDKTTCIKISPELKTLNDINKAMLERILKKLEFLNKRTEIVMSRIDKVYYSLAKDYIPTILSNFEKIITNTVSCENSDTENLVNQTIMLINEFLSNNSRYISKHTKNNLTEVIDIIKSIHERKLVLFKSIVDGNYKLCTLGSFNSYCINCEPTESSIDFNKCYNKLLEHIRDNINNLEKRISIYIDKASIDRHYDKLKKYTRALINRIHEILLST